MSASGRDLTALFVRMRHGDAAAVNAVIGALYAELHHLVARQMRGEARQHTLQPTALVKEVCEILGEKLPTVRRDWVFARSWLKTRFQPVSRK